MMAEHDDPGRGEEERRDGDAAADREKEPDPPETTRHPVPGVEHEPEPSGENLIPAKDRPGTL